MEGLPKKICPLKNTDKGFMEDWTPRRDLLNFPHSFRMLCLGPPNVGKSTAVKNVVVRAKPKFDIIYLLHCDILGTTEYDDIEAEKLTEIPAPYDAALFDRKKKSLLIMDDMEFQFMNRGQKKKLDRLFGYTSTHRSLSIVVCAQDFFNLPPCIRRMSNVIVVWHVLDLDLKNTIGRRIGLKKGEFDAIAQRHWNGVHDSLWVDTTKGTKYPLRLNGYCPIDLTTGDVTRCKAPNSPRGGKVSRGELKEEKSDDDEQIST